MSQKQDLLDAEEIAWRDLCARYEALSDDQRASAPPAGWSPKDVLAHIAVWHALTTDLFECLRSGTEPPPQPDTDAFNAEQHERNKDLTLKDVAAMSGASRHRFREEIALIEEMSDMLAKIVAANGHGHYAEHLADLDVTLETT